MPFSRRRYFNVASSPRTSATTISPSRAVGQAADEAAFFQCRDQPVDPRLGFQFERLAHLVETRADPGRGETVVDEAQQFMLLDGEHRRIPFGTDGERVGNEAGAVKRHRDTLRRRRR